MAPPGPGEDTVDHGLRSQLYGAHAKSFQPEKYIFIYSRFTEDGEFGLPTSNYTLAYAYSDAPLGPWTYGGTIIDGRGREKDEQGNVIASATPDGNTHGSICEINGQWYVFYHRHTGTDEYARQAMVAPIDVKVEEGKGGKVEISEGEYNSQGFALNGLDPFERHSAGIACWYTGPKPAVHEWPNNTFYGSYIDASYGGTPEMSKQEALAWTNSQLSTLNSQLSLNPYDLRYNTNRVVNNTDGSIVGYKYFNFDAERLASDGNLMLVLRLIPEGIEGDIDIMIDRPWISQGGTKIGEIHLLADMEKKVWDIAAGIRNEIKEKSLAGKHALFFVFRSDVKDQSLCTLEDLVFTFNPTH